MYLVLPYILPRIPHPVDTTCFSGATKDEACRFFDSLRGTLVDGTATEGIIAMYYDGTFFNLLKCSIPIVVRDNCILLYPFASLFLSMAEMHVLSNVLFTDIDAF